MVSVRCRKFGGVHKLLSFHRDVNVACELNANGRLLLALLLECSKNNIVGNPAKSATITSILQSPPFFYGFLGFFTCFL